MSKEDGKNILIFLDGTSNKFGDELTNVVRAYSVVVKNSKQIALYIPGVGSISDRMELFKPMRLMKKWAGLGFGYGLQKKVIEAYSFLMKNYEPNDKIYLFGFSRGAYTAKVVAGLIHACGLLHKDNESHIEYAYELYTREKLDFNLLGGFKKRFSHDIPDIHFMGLWDSVSSVGNIRRMRNYPYTTNVQNVKTIRHALAIDEKRALFKNNSTFSKGDDIKQVWFGGTHGNVGGGHIEEKSAYAKVPLKWMLDEAQSKGLKIEKELYGRYVISNNVKGYTPLDPNGDLYKNDFLTWGVLELLPRYNTNYNTGKKEWYWPLFARRVIPENSLIHSSITNRLKAKTYSASNIPGSYLIEP